MALITNLLHYWNFDEESGDLIDQHGSNDGDVTGCTYEETGKINYSYGFAGSNNIIKCGDIADIRKTHDFSISAWFYATGTGAVFGKGENEGCGLNNDNYMRIYIQADGDIQVDVGCQQETPYQYITSGTDYRNQWVFVVLTHNSNDTITVYVNGSELDSGTDNATTNWDVNTVFGIGDTRGSGTYIPFNGYVDEMGVWNKVLDSSEVTELWNSGDGLAYPFTGAVIERVSGYSDAFVSVSYPT